MCLDYRPPEVPSYPPYFVFPRILWFCKELNKPPLWDLVLKPPDNVHSSSRWACWWSELIDTTDIGIRASDLEQKAESRAVCGDTPVVQSSHITWAGISGSISHITLVALWCQCLQKKQGSKLHVKTKKGGSALHSVSCVYRVINHTRY